MEGRQGVVWPSLPTTAPPLPLPAPGEGVLRAPPGPLLLAGGTVYGLVGGGVKARESGGGVVSAASDGGFCTHHVRSYQLLVMPTLVYAVHWGKGNALAQGKVGQTFGQSWTL